MHKLGLNTDCMSWPKYFKDRGKKPLRWNKLFWLLIDVETNELQIWKSLFH